MSRALTAAEILRAWEDGVRLPPALRPLALLEPLLASPAEVTDELARLPIGRRDARLMDLREDLFGPKLTCAADCPACAEAIDLEFDLNDMRVPPPSAAEESVQPVRLERDGWSLDVRLPDSHDLMAAAAAVAGGSDAALAKRVLLQRCVTSARSPSGEQIPTTDLPEALALAVAQSMAEADPQADVRLAMNCPHCGHAWDVPFDIAAFLWGEVQATARRLLREVHELAWAYGWRESEILAMTAARRAAYLELLRG